jgi:hypothetical protein
VAGIVDALATTDIAGNSVLAAGGCERVVMHDSAASRCGGTDFDQLQESLDLWAMIYHSPLLGRRVFLSCCFTGMSTCSCHRYMMSPWWSPVVLNMYSSTHSETVKGNNHTSCVIAVLKKESFVFEVILVFEYLVYAKSAALLPGFTGNRSLLLIWYILEGFGDVSISAPIISV